MGSIAVSPPYPAHRSSPMPGGGRHRALYEAIRRVGARSLDAVRPRVGVLLSGLNWVRVALLVVASTLLVYLGAVLLARLGVLWAFYP